ncbi:MAG: hypothetical protein K0R22_749 [Sporomusa sp.]|jgi:hypothetical protein|nr:hypothetical protein [Sporomusa sp.]
METNYRIACNKDWQDLIKEISAIKNSTVGAVFLLQENAICSLNIT